MSSKSSGKSCLESSKDGCFGNGNLVKANGLYWLIPGIIETLSRLSGARRKTRAPVLGESTLVTGPDSPDRWRAGKRWGNSRHGTRPDRRQRKGVIVKQGDRPRWHYSFWQKKLREQGPWKVEKCLIAGILEFCNCL
jgi:hypothetical protein